MEGWSVLSNDSAYNFPDNGVFYHSDGDCGDMDHLVEINGVCNDDFHNNTAKARSLFDQVFSLFLKESGSRGTERPAPALLGDGGSVDFFKLFCAVRDRGGYFVVSKRGLWSMVVGEMGLDFGLEASLKLIYYKYLFEFKKWLEKEKNGSVRNFHLVSFELEKEINELFFNGLVDKDIEFMEASDGDDPLDSKNRKRDSIISTFKHDVCRIQLNGKRTRVDHEKVCDDDDKLGCLNVSARMNEKENKYHLRKQETHSEMLKWVIQAAKQPVDPSIGEIPEPSEWKEYQGNEFWFQAITVRNTLLFKMHNDSSIAHSLLQKKMKMHPSMFEDDVRPHRQFSERLRYSGRLSLRVRSHPCSCCETSSANHHKLITPKELKTEKSSNKLEPKPSEEDSVPMEVSVGPLFQVEVPEWTGAISESDSKWLGTRARPFEFNEIDDIENNSACGCRHPGSVECVRFHIAEKRMKLKLELGPVFYQWRFHHMGEEISLGWTDEEEKRFKDMMRVKNQSQDKYLLDGAIKLFPEKTKENIISYYFNVFLLQIRCYQNRATPQNIDSDDDEVEFGHVCSSFKREITNVTGTKYLRCLENKQCTDFD